MPLGRAGSIPAQRTKTAKGRFLPLNHLLLVNIEEANHYNKEATRRVALLFLITIWNFLTPVKFQ